MEIISYYIAQLLSAKTVKLVFTQLIIIFTWLFGGIEIAGYALGAVMIIDFVLGFYISAKKNRIQRSKMKSWMMKFITYGLLIIIGNMVDNVIFHQVMEYGFKNAFIVYLCIHESLSVIHHLQTLGVPIPSKIVQKLEQYRDTAMDIVPSNIHH